MWLVQGHRAGQWQNRQTFDSVHPISATLCCITCKSWVFLLNFHIFYPSFEDMLEYLWLPFPFYFCHSTLWLICHSSLNFPPLDIPSLISLDVLYLPLSFFWYCLKPFFPEAGLLSLVSLAGTVFPLCVYGLLVHSIFLSLFFPTRLEICVCILSCFLKPVPFWYAFGLMLSA